MRPSLGRLRSAVEMTGPWKTWKTRRRFPTFPTAPWKSPTVRFPHSHRADNGPPSMNTENKNQDLAPALPAKHNRSIHPTMNTCPRPLRQGIKSCVLSHPPMAGFEVTPYGRFSGDP